MHGLPGENLKAAKAKISIFTLQSLPQYWLSWSIAWEEVSLLPDKRSASSSGPCMVSLRHCPKGAKVRLERSCDGKILVFGLFCPHGRRLRKGNKLGYNGFVVVDKLCF